MEMVQFFVPGNGRCDTSLRIGFAAKDHLVLECANISQYLELEENRKNRIPTLIIVPVPKTRMNGQ